MKTPVFAVLSVMLLLGGCSSEGGDWESFLNAATQYWNSDNAVSIEQASAIPFATLGMREDGGPQQVFVLATDDDGVRLWTSSGHVSLQTRDGRIIRTAGLGTDQSSHNADSTAPEAWLTPHRYAWSADFPDIGRYSVAIACRVAPAGSDPIQILGKTFNTVRVDESCESPSLSWSFANTYWVSAKTGRVWRSIQHINPNGPELEVELLRPPVGDR